MLNTSNIDLSYRRFSDNRLSKPLGQNKSVITSTDRQVQNISPDAYSPSIRFGHVLTEDYTVVQPYNLPVSSSSAANALRALMLDAAQKSREQDPSNLKLVINSNAWDYDDDKIKKGKTKKTSRKASTSYMYQLYGAGDMLMLLNRPVDTVVTAEVGPHAIFPLQMPRLLYPQKSRLYMASTAMMMFGPWSTQYSGRYSEFGSYNKRLTDFIRRLESLLMLTSGEKDRAKVHQLLIPGRILTALECLAFGEKGLADAILLQGDRVLTREGLERYYSENNYRMPESIARFNEFAGNVHKIPKRYLVPLEKFNAASLSRKHDQRDFDPESKDSGQSGLVLERPFGKAFSVPSKRFSPESVVSEDADGVGHLRWKKAGWLPEGILYDDLIFFHARFNVDSARKALQALKAIERKKLAEAKETGREPSHIKILLNSKGGRVAALQELIHEIETSKVPVDVITYGRAASCGAVLLSSATGKRYGTLNSHFLIHDTRWVSHEELPPEGQDAHYKREERINALMVGQISKASGRSEFLVKRDSTEEIWLNALEALFYGKKGLIDAVLVDGNHAVTRDDVLNYLNRTTDFKTSIDNIRRSYYPDSKRVSPVDFLAAGKPKKWQDKVDPDKLFHLIYNQDKPPLDPNEWEARYQHNPFVHPLETFLAIAPQATSLDDKKFKGLLPSKHKVVDQYFIA